MFLMCWIDGDDGNTALWKFGNSIEELKAHANNNEGEKCDFFEPDECPIAWDDTKDEVYGYIARGDSYAEDFSCYFIFEVPDDAKVFLLSWHAFEGVDFSVEVFSEIESARAKMNLDYEKLLSENSYEDGCFIDKYSATIDTGVEWENWYIFDR